jgi:hypothetical protein
LRNKFFGRSHKEKIFESTPIDVPDIFQRYLDNPVFTNNSWGGFQSSIDYWKSQQYKTILVSDEIFDSDYLNLFDGNYLSVKDLGPKIFKNSIFFVRFVNDEEASSEISHIVRSGGKFVSSIESAKTPYRFTNKRALVAMQKTWAQREVISHLLPIVHENLCEALEITKSVEGLILEIGVYKGGSALTILNYLDLLKDDESSLPEREYIGIDTFNGFDYEVAKSSPDLIWYKTHSLSGAGKTLDSVRRLLSTSNTKSTLHKLDICSDDLPWDITKISMANIDVDMYEPTKAALEKVSPLVQTGGLIICEDATSTPALYGASLALSEFSDSREGKKYIKFHKLGQIFLFKIKK